METFMHRTALKGYLVYWATLSFVLLLLRPVNKMNPDEVLEWWQGKAIYHIYPKSFCDSNGDGVGDLNGIQSKIPYLVSLGIGAIWLSPIYPSPQVDHGYDVSNYIDIDPIFGNLGDFQTLLRNLHDHGLKLIMDFVPNHTSDRHEWFEKSARREDPFTDYYVWKDGRNGSVPNNWVSARGGSMWTWHPSRGQYYLHQYAKEQPDLNLRNQVVVTELTNAMQFWLDLGVDGFRMDAVTKLFEDPEFRDEPVIPGRPPGGYHSLDHIHTVDLPEVLELLKKFRDTLDRKTAEDEKQPRIMVTEAYLASKGIVKYYGAQSGRSGDISHMPINFDLIRQFRSKSDLQPQKESIMMESLVRKYLSSLPPWAWPNFHFGNHDQPRLATRLGRSLVDAINMVVMLLPGTPIMYYGEEIGMASTGAVVTDQRDPSRTPMQWSSETNAGFCGSDANPWLSVNADYPDFNVAKQENSLSSHLAIYRRLAEIRQTPDTAVLRGSLKMLVRDSTFAFARRRQDNAGEGCLVAVNMSDDEVLVDVSSLTGGSSGAGKVMVRSSSASRKSVNFNGIKLLPWEGIVVKIG